MAWIIILFNEDEQNAFICLQILQGSIDSGGCPELHCQLG